MKTEQKWTEINYEILPKTNTKKHAKIQQMKSESRSALGHEIRVQAGPATRNRRPGRPWSTKSVNSEPRAALSHDIGVQVGPGARNQRNRSPGRP